MLGLAENNFYNAYGSAKYMAKVLSDTKLEIKIAKNELAEATTYVYDKSKGTVTEAPKKGSYADVYVLDSHLPDGGNLYFGG
ncbi:hypothetical protein FACS1894120_0250 [Clostridia bacterium]|nr:hypothetical protein FACS1894120_0250 [Clostridia bacterium]